MDQNIERCFEHRPVLLKESIEALDVKPSGIYFDCTLGGGGHAGEILNKMDGSGTFVGMDRDTEALTAAGERLKKLSSGVRIELVHDNFAEVAAAADKLGICRANGILMDIGVSSHQLDMPDRGFSYMKPSKLDMRMNREDSLTAYKVVNEYSEEELERIIYKYGEERWGARIVRFIAEARREKPITTTIELVDIIKRAIPKKARMDGPHPAKRVFQAIRIEVNDELESLRKAIRDGFNLLESKGRMCIITFHSLEARMVRQEFAKLVKGCTCPPDFPVCICGKEKQGRLINRKPVTPGEEELSKNPRARSAELRIIEHS